MAATTDVTVQCRCGAVRGVAAVAASAGNHCVCYCDDCQAFQHFLGRENDVLDAVGGTEIFQLSPAKLTFSAGAERLACMQLTTKGLLRWYASCCNTPIGNTMAAAGMPFVGLVCACLRDTSGALGPIRGRAFPESAKGGVGAVPKDGLPALLMIARVAAFIVLWRLRGDHRRWPLFDAAGRPRATPRILTDVEREDLRRRCATWRGAAPSARAAPRA